MLIGLRLKCNREKPCQNCIVRGDVAIASCSYAEKADGRSSTASNSKSNSDDMRARISRLENSIMSMISDSKSGHIPDPSGSVFSATNLEENGINQAGGQRISVDTRSTHWDTILNELGAMKEAWSDEPEQLDPALPSATPSHRPGLLAGLTPPPDRATILASLPSKAAADKLTQRFFDSYNPSIPATFLVHRPTFLKQIESHWAEPHHTKIIWIGLYFATLCMALQSYTRNNDAPSEYSDSLESLTHLYRVRTVQCLTIADMTKPVDFMVETLLCYTFIEYAYERDGDMGTWLLSGTIVHLALQQGYHRDPTQHSNLTVFQGEMRRRVWAIIIQHELIFSAQIGLPKSTRFAECDTSPPSNLNECELSENMTILPPSRPVSEPTSICYQIVKFGIMKAYGDVIEFLHIVQPQPYSEVIRLDAMLKRAADMVPSHLQLGTLEEMKHDTPAAAMEKYVLQKLYRKAVIVLHRKYWDAERKNNSEELRWFSRRMCVSSAMTLLEYQVSMHEASQPGGILSLMKWWQFSITNHDFLLAAMIICLDLNTNQWDYLRSGTMSYCSMTEKSKLNVLCRARDIWGEVADKCIDAKRAADILTSVISRLRIKVDKTVQLDLNPNLVKRPIYNDFSLYDVPPFPQIAVDVPVPPPIYPFTTDNMIRDDMFDTGGIFGTFGNQVDIPPSFDWDAWDQLVVGPQALNQDIFTLPPDFQYQNLGGRRMD
ncbi:hypothetical protein ACMFMG_002885 [Clarireedia jacksonii]